MKNQIIYYENQENEKKIYSYNEKFNIHIIELSNSNSNILIEIFENIHNQLDMIDIQEMVDFIMNNDINEILDSFKMNEEEFDRIIIER